MFGLGTNDNLNRLRSVYATPVLRCVCMCARACHERQCACFCMSVCVVWIDMLHIRNELCTKMRYLKCNRSFHTTRPTYLKILICCLCCILAVLFIAAATVEVLRSSDTSLSSFVQNLHLCIQTSTLLPHFPIPVFLQAYYERAWLSGVVSWKQHRAVAWQGHARANDFAFRNTHSFCAET